MLYIYKFPESFIKAIYSNSFWEKLTTDKSQKIVRDEIISDWLRLIYWKYDKS